MGEWEEKLQSILGDPNTMNQIMALAQSITGNAEGSDTSAQSGEENTPPEADLQSGGDLFSALGELDPRLLQIGMRLLSEYNSEDEKKTAFLSALQPFIQERRRGKVDQAIRIAKLSHVIRIALDAFRKGDSDYV